MNKLLLFKVKKNFTILFLRVKNKVIKKNRHSIRWGIIGLGNMGNYFAIVINSDPNSKLVAVASRNIKKAKKFSKKHGCKNYFGSYKSMILDSKLKLDIVYIATPVLQHYNYIKFCINNGVSVLVEKPITYNLNQLDSILALRVNNGVFVKEAMWMKCLPTYKKALQIINQCEIGQLQLIKVSFNKMKINSNINSFYEGALKDYGVYAISFCVGFMKTDNIRVVSHWSKFDNEIDTNWFIHLSDGVVNAHISISSNIYSDSKASLICENGNILFDSQFNRTNKITIYNNTGKIKNKYYYKYKLDGFEYQIRSVNSLVKNKSLINHILPMNESKKTIEIIDYLIDS